MDGSLNHENHKNHEIHEIHEKGKKDKSNELETKAVSVLTDIPRAQVLNALKTIGYNLYLLINSGHYSKLEAERIVR